MGGKRPTTGEGAGDAGSSVVELEGVRVHLAHPDELNVRWVGQEEPRLQDLITARW